MAERKRAIADLLPSPTLGVPGETHLVTMCAVIVGQLHQRERGELTVDLGEADAHRYGYKQRLRYGYRQRIKLNRPLKSGRFSTVT